MRYKILIFFLSAISLAHGQASFPKGIYMNYDELKSGKSSRAGEFVVERRSSSDIFMVGGNDYKIKSTNDSASKSDIKWSYYAISTGDSVFINGSKFEIGAWYCLLHTDSEYYYFSGGPCTNRQNPMFIQSGSSAAALGGGIVGGIAAGQHALERYLYLIDRQTGLADVITVYYLRSSFAKKNMDLFREYNTHPTRDSIDTQLKYYKILKTLK